MLTKLNSKITEAAIKYFIAQAIASLILICRIIFNYEVYERINIESIEYIVTIAMLIKAGIAPFHFWFPQVINNSEWTQCIILLTWQKVAPFILLTSLNLHIIIASSVVSAIVGCIGGFNQIKIKIILTYSSIAHSAWIIRACLISNLTWITYFLIYRVISFSVIRFFKKSNIRENLNEINLWPVSNVLKILLILNIISLGGLPPLLGFLGKLIIINIMINTNIIFYIIVLILRSLISLYFYCHMIYTATLFKSLKIFIKSDKTITENFLPIATVSFNVIIPVVVILT